MLLVVDREFSHDLPGQNHNALAQPILHISVYPELLRAILRIQGIVAQINEASDL